MTIVSVQVDKPDEDNEIPVTIRFLMCCPEHTAEVIAALIATFNETIGETMAAIKAHNSIKEEFNNTLKESMTKIDDPTAPAANHNLNKDLN